MEESNEIQTDHVAMEVPLSHPHDGYRNHHDSMLPFPLQFPEYAGKIISQLI